MNTRGLSLRARAEAGEAAAQYDLAAQLQAAGRSDNARLWLERAAAQDYPDAVFTMSAARLTGAAGADLDPQSGAEGVKRAAELGSAPAMRVLTALFAAGFPVVGAWSEACSFLARSLANDDPIALREAAMALLMCDANDPDGAAMINHAAPRDAIAAAIAVRRASLGRSGASTSVAREVLPLLKTARYPLASLLSQRLDSATASGDAVNSFDRERAVEKLCSQSFSITPHRGSLCARPNIRMQKAAYTPEECDYMIGRAAPRLDRAQIVDDNIDEARIDPHRTAWCASFHAGSIDLPLVLFARRLSEIADIPFDRAEPMNVLRYRLGEEYRPHHDFLSDAETDLARRGQRVRTALIYLNDDFTGGETHFLQPDIKFVGDPGDVIVFDNVDAAGAPDISARHASRPVISGEKWLASIWFRDRPYTP